MTWEVAILVIGTILGTGGIATLITSRAQSSKLAAEATLQVQSYYSGALESQNEHIGRLERRVDALGTRVDELTRALTDTEMLRRRAEVALSEVWVWVDSGAEPPPPRRPPWMHSPTSPSTPTENID